MHVTTTVTAPRTVRLERLLPGTLETVWEYLTDADKRGQWLASGPMELRPGGAVELHFNNAELTPDRTAAPERFKQYDCAMVLRGTMQECDPPRRLRFTWGDRPDPSEVLFELSQQDSAVLLTITHSNLPGRGDMVMVSGGWHLHTDILAERLAGRPSAPFWPRFVEMEAHYQAAIPQDAAA